MMESRSLACTPSEVPRNFHLAVSSVTADITSRRSSSPSNRSREYQNWLDPEAVATRCMLPQKYAATGQQWWPAGLPESIYVSYSYGIITQLFPSIGLPVQLTKHSGAIHSLLTWRTREEKPAFKIVTIQLKPPNKGRQRLSSSQRFCFLWKFLKDEK